MMATLIFIPSQINIQKRKKVLTFGMNSSLYQESILLKWIGNERQRSIRNLLNLTSIQTFGHDCSTETPLFTRMKNVKEILLSHNV